MEPAQMNGKDNEKKSRGDCRDLLRHMEMIGSSLQMLCECFLRRAHDADQDPLWHRFYTIQMSSYLIGKKNLEVSPPEGDMVHDLIRDCWMDIKDYMENSKFGPVSNVDQWFKTIRIDFPLDPFDPDCTFFSSWPTLVCQNETKKESLG